MKVAIIGSGGREHAIQWKLSRSISEKDIYVLPGNGGIPNSYPIDINNFSNIRSFCDREKIKLIIVGPEIHLAKGIVDFFKGSKIKVFGPTQKTSMLESSKIYAKKFMSKYGVSTSNCWIISGSENAQLIIKKLNGNLVIKYDGLASGKGVYVCSSIEESLQAVNELQSIYGKEAPFLIEEKLSGYEMSIIGITDGKCIKLLSPSQDHKQLYDGDKGPNTGGMGAYCPIPQYDEELATEITKTIIEPTIRGIISEKLEYKGIIYFGLMITVNGPKLLEYNVRFGDPETEVILPALKNNLLQLVLACFDGSLSRQDIDFRDGYYVDVVLASSGYPKNYSKGFEIKGLDTLNSDILVFHSGTEMKNGKLVTNGGRVLNIISHGLTIDSAIEKCYQECKKIYFDNMYYRTDIGRRHLNR